MYTSVHEDSELIFDEPRDQKTMVSQEVYCLLVSGFVQASLFELCQARPLYRPVPLLFGLAQNPKYVVLQEVYYVRTSKNKGLQREGWLSRLA